MTVLGSMTFSALVLGLGIVQASAQPRPAVLTCPATPDREQIYLELEPGHSVAPFAVRRGSAGHAEWGICYGGNAKDSSSPGAPLSSRELEVPLDPSDVERIKAEGPWLWVSCPIQHRFGDAPPYTYEISEDFYIPQRAVEGKRPAGKPLVVVWMLNRVPNPHPRAVFSGCTVTPATP